MKSCLSYALVLVLIALSSRGDGALVPKIISIKSKAKKLGSESGQMGLVEGLVDNGLWWTLGKLHLRKKTEEDHALEMFKGYARHKAIDLLVRSNTSVRPSSTLEREILAERSSSDPYHFSLRAMGELVRHELATESIKTAYADWFNQITDSIENKLSKMVNEKRELLASTKGPEITAAEEDPLRVEQLIRRWEKMLRLCRSTHCKDENTYLSHAKILLDLHLADQRPGLKELVSQYETLDQNMTDLLASTFSPESFPLDFVQKRTLVHGNEYSWALKGD